VRSFEKLFMRRFSTNTDDILVLFRLEDEDTVDAPGSKKLQHIPDSGVLKHMLLVPHIARSLGFGFFLHMTKERGNFLLQAGKQVGLNFDSLQVPERETTDKVSLLVHDGEATDAIIEHSIESVGRLGVLLHSDDLLEDILREFSQRHVEEATQQVLVPEHEIGHS